MGERGVTRYQLVVSGFRPGTQREPADILHAVLGMDPARAAQLARELPCVVGTTPRLDYAQAYAAQLAEAGAEVHIRPHAPEARAEPQAVAATDPSVRGGYALGDLDVAPVKPGARPMPASGPSAPLASHEPTHARDAAFGGLRDLSESFEGLASNQAGFQVQVDEQVLREVQTRPRQEADARARQGLFARLGRRLAGLGAQAVQWALGTLALSVVLAITAALVSYGLDPDHVLDDVALARARQGVAAWFGSTTDQADAPPRATLGESP